MKIKLSATQKKVVRLIRNGYEIGYYEGFQGHASLQNGGLGKGGKSEKITNPTFFSLLDKKIIEKGEKESGRVVVPYKLTELGKTVEL